MRVKLLTLQYSPSLGGFDDRPLTDFIVDKELLAVREHFFSVSAVPHVACLVTFRDPRFPTSTAPRSDAADPRRSRRSDVDADLSPEERVLFGSLRQWRAARARKDGVPAYLVLSNRQLRDLIRQRPASRTALATIQGIGPAKVERYGTDLLRLVGGPSREAPPEAVSNGPDDEPRSDGP